MFKKKEEGLLIKGWAYGNFIQRHNLMKFYYSKLLVLKHAIFERIAGESSYAGDETWHCGIDRTYLDPQQIESQQHPEKNKAGVQLSTIL